MPLFRRCGTGPTEGVVRWIMAGGKGQRQIITDPQTAGIRIRIALMYRFSALGTAEIVRVA